MKPKLELSTLRECRVLPVITVVDVDSTVLLAKALQRGGMKAIEITLRTEAALAISGAPFNGPIGGARVGFNDKDGYILNPTYEQLESSKLNMVVAGTEAALGVASTRCQ